VFRLMVHGPLSNLRAVAVSSLLHSLTSHFLHRDAAGPLQYLYMYLPPLVGLRGLTPIITAGLIAVVALVLRLSDASVNLFHFLMSLLKAMTEDLIHLTVVQDKPNLNCQLLLPQI